MTDSQKAAQEIYDWLDKAGYIDSHLNDRTIVDAMIAIAAIIDKHLC